jgi:hypothetical protein
MNERLDNHNKYQGSIFIFVMLSVALINVVRVTQDTAAEFVVGLVATVLLARCFRAAYNLNLYKRDVKKLFASGKQYSFEIIPVGTASNTPPIMRTTQQGANHEEDSEVPVHPSSSD